MEKSEIANPGDRVKFDYENPETKEIETFTGRVFKTGQNEIEVFSPEIGPELLRISTGGYFVSIPYSNSLMMNRKFAEFEFAFDKIKQKHFGHIGDGDVSRRSEGAGHLSITVVDEIDESIKQDIIQVFNKIVGIR